MSPKTPEEWREYRFDHKDTINANRKISRARKKEEEKLRLMKPLALEIEEPETAARPAKAEQQSVAACESNDTTSLAQLEPAVPAKKGTTPSEEFAQVSEEQPAQELGWAQVSGLSFVAQVPKQPALWVVPQPDVTSQDPACEEQEPKAEDTSEQHKAGRCEKVTGEQPAARHKAGKSFLTYFFSLCMIIFLGFNTAFLVLEQSSLYTSLGYTGTIALMIAVLTESALILFSTMAAWSPGWIWKAGLYGGMLGTGFVIFSLLNVSVENRAAGKVSNSEQAEMLKKEIVTQEALEATALAIIDNLDPRVYPTRISLLKAKLNGPGPEGHTFRLGQLRERLATLSATGTVQAEIQVLQWQRWASMVWNVLLAGFLGYLWKRKRSGSEFS